MNTTIPNNSEQLPAKFPTTGGESIPILKYTAGQLTTSHGALDPGTNFHATASPSKKCACEGDTCGGVAFNPTTAVKYCNDMENPFPPDTSFNGGGGSCSEAAGLAAGAHPDITTQLAIPNGDLNLSNVVTLAPNSETIAAGSTMPAGEKMGALHSDITLGTFSGPCNLTIGVDFILFNVALPNVPSDPRASTNITYPQPQGTPDRFGRWGTPGAGPIGIGGGNAITAGSPPAQLQAASNADPIQGYPSFLLDAFDPDYNALTHVDGPLKPLVPIAVYGGLDECDRRVDPALLRPVRLRRAGGPYGEPVE
jgi:hypothetical protein